MAQALGGAVERWLSRGCAGTVRDGRQSQPRAVACRIARCSPGSCGRWEPTSTPLAPWLIPADHRDWPSRCLFLPRLRSGLFPEEVRADMAVQLALAGAPRGGGMLVARRIREAAAQWG